MNASLVDTPVSLSDRIALLRQRGLVEQLAARELEIGKARDGAIAWTVEGIRQMHAQGRDLCEAQELLAGDYTDWFAAHAEQIGFSIRTAGTYKKVFRDIERMGGWDAALERFPDRHDFLVALGVLKARETGELQTSGERPPFTVKFTYVGPPIAELTPEARRDLRQKLKPAADKYAELVEAERTA